MKNSEFSEVSGIVQRGSDLKKLIKSAIEKVKVEMYEAPKYVESIQCKDFIVTSL